MCIRDRAMANVCIVIIFIVIVAAGLAIAVVTTLIGKMCIRDRDYPYL